jgi:hypothetical protein
LLGATPFPLSQEQFPSRHSGVAAKPPPPPPPPPLSARQASARQFDLTSHPAKPTLRFAQRPYGGVMESSQKDLEEKVAKLQRAVYYLIWKRTGFGEQCLHCGHSYPGHAERCKGSEIEEMVR